MQDLAAREALQAGLPFDLIDAVMKIESDYRPDRIGAVGEIGVMQVRPTTAAMLGFRGSAAELAEPATNIHYGATYLGEAWRLAGGHVCRALMKYRAGHGNETMTPLSVSYCQRAQAHLLGIASPLAATILPADLIATTAVTAAVDASKPQGPRPTQRREESLFVAGRAKTGPAFWAAFQARVRRINAGIEAKWRKVAAR